MRSRNKCFLIYQSHAQTLGHHHHQHRRARCSYTKCRVDAIIIPALCTINAPLKHKDTRARGVAEFLRFCPPTPAPPALMPTPSTHPCPQSCKALALYFNMYHYVFGRRARTKRSRRGAAHNKHKQILSPGKTRFCIIYLTCMCRVWGGTYYIEREKERAREQRVHAHNIYTTHTHIPYTHANLNPFSKENGARLIYVLSLRVCCVCI